MASATEGVGQTRAAVQAVLLLLLLFFTSNRELFNLRFESLVITVVSSAVNVWLTLGDGAHLGLSCVL